MHCKHNKLKLGVISLFILILSSGIAAAQISDKYMMNISINGNEFKFANHNESKTEGNWIYLDGGVTLQQPSPMKVTYNGVNETSFSTNGNDVYMNMNVNNYTDHTIKYPFDTHQMYVNNSQDDVDIQFYGSNSFADKKASVFLLKANSSSIIEVFEGISDGSITSFSDVEDKVTVSSKSNSSVVLDSNGDLSYSFNDLDAGNYAVVIVLNDEPVILTFTTFGVMDYELDTNTSSFVTSGDNLSVDLKLKNASDTEYKYTAGLMNKNAYKIDMRMESNGQKDGTNSILNNEMMVDGFDLVGMSISDMNEEDLRSRSVDVVGSNNMSNTTKTVNSNQTTLNIDTDNLPPGYYTLLLEAQKSEDPMVAFGQKNVTVTSEDSCENVETIISEYVNIKSGESVECNYGKGCIGSIECTPNVDMGNTSITIEYLNNQSSNVPANISGQVYRNANIWIGSGDVPDDYIENATVSFKINKPWLIENNVNKSSINLNRFVDGKWQTLPTKIVDEDDDYVCYKAKTPGFSPFAIAGQEQKEETGVTTTNPILMVGVLGIAMLLFLKRRGE
ncbi:TIGR04279 domain-containing protein [Methanohalobium sp.]|uniref:TIGR04279 domain-containing protein n=1 Tax=Methanohalobium sp. TaxID=2837493 RepID=UPI0025EB9FEB|nr:TIGR04279 domain-containing protein [Methanohalobium sp.]